MRFKFRYFYLVFCFSISQVFKAQEMYFQSMASSLNLPSDECYNIIQDRRGYIWIATDNGLCRFNGVTTRIYNKQLGLPEKSIYFMEERENGSILLISSANRILQMVNDTLKEFSFTQPYTKFMKEQGNPDNASYSVRINPDKTVLVTNYNFSGSIDLSDRIRKLELTAGTKSKTNYLVYANGSESFFIKYANTSVTNLAKRKGRFSIDIICRGIRKQVNVDFNENQFPGTGIRMVSSGNHLYLSLGHQLVRFNTTTLKHEIYEFSNAILSIRVDKKGGLWIGLRKSGLLYFKDAGKMKDAIESLHGYSVSGICEDYEEGIWCTTLEKNVFYCKNPDVLYFPKVSELTKKSSFLKAINDSLFTSTAIDQLLILYKNKISRKILVQSKYGEVTDVVKHNQRWYISTKLYLMGFDNAFENSHHITSKKRTNSGAIRQMDTCNGQLFGLSTFGLSEIGIKNYKYATGTLSPKPWVMLWFGRNTFLVGSNEGLYTLDIQTKAIEKIPGIDRMVTRLIRTREGTIYIATRDEGLWKMENKHPVFIGEDYPYEIFDLEEDGAGNIWLATNAGLIKLKKDLNGKFTKQVFTAAQGLLSNAINNLAITSKNVFAATADGLFYMPLDANTTKTIAPRVFVNTFTCNGDTITDYSRAFKFKHWQNSFLLSLDILSFKKNKESLSLSYMLAGRDTSFRIHEGNTLAFENLPPGTYELIVNAVNYDGIKSRQTIRINFEIQNPYWRTWWFISACACVFLLLVFLSAKISIARIRKKEREKTRINKLIAESQLSALQAQMNPHFIFNAINSIQSYILKKEEKEAYDYLGKFSRLIRIVLTHSRQNSVSLSQELEFIKLYVELEQLRFKYKFIFELLVDETINLPGTELPTMLIQPFVENAIWHGLMNLDERRVARLNIQVSQIAETIRITIEDNGIGRVKARQYKEKNTVRSLGLRMIDERLEMINQVRGQEDIKVEIHDLYDTSGNACGTKVELTLEFE